MVLYTVFYTAVMWCFTRYSTGVRPEGVPGASRRWRTSPTGSAAAAAAAEEEEAAAGQREGEGKTAGHLDGKEAVGIDNNFLHAIVTVRESLAQAARRYLLLKYLEPSKGFVCR
jgi:hypothetical protein